MGNLFGLSNDHPSTKRRNPLVLPLTSHNIYWLSKCLADLKDVDTFTKTHFPAGKVVKCTAIRKFKENGMFQVIIGDESDARVMNVYTNKEETRRNYSEGRTIMVSNFKVVKGVIQCNNYTTVLRQTTHVEVNEEKCKQAETKLYGTVSTVTLAQALTSPKKMRVTTSGKIVKVYKLQENSEGTPIKSFKLKDKTGKCRVSLWRDLAASPVKEGDSVSLSNVTCSTYNERPNLNSCGMTDIQYLPAMDISSEDSDDEDDVQLNRSNKEVGQITSVGNISLYPGCNIPKCNRKKLDKDGRCGSCSKRVAPSCAETGMRALIGIKVENDHRTLTLFNDKAETLFKLVTSKDVCPKVDSEFEDQLFDNLPITVAFVANANNIINFISKV